MKKIALYIFVCLFTVINAWATHNRAGEITYKHDPLPDQPHRFTFEVITYTKTSSFDADRDSLLIFWGNNDDSSFLPRVNGFNNEGEIVENRDDIKKNIYRGSYSYPGASTYYVVSMADPNRIDEIVNINQGLSVDIQFFIEDTLFLINPQFYGYNNSPILSQPPIDNGQIGEVFKHNPNAFDIDGDSLVFELTVPLQSTNLPVPNYAFPDEVQPGANNNITLNPNTGEFIWDSPQLVGEYNVAFLIREYRNGIQIGTMIRDMQILIEDLNNTPPELNSTADVCVTVGDQLTFNIEANESEDPANSQQIIELSAFGGPFEVAISPARLININEQINFASATFVWDIVCEHIYSDEYIVVIKAEDNFEHPITDQPIPLSDLFTWLIRVVPPPIENLTTEAQAGKITLNWGLNDNYQCSDSENFLGFSVWRKAACDNSDIEICDNNLASQGYTLLTKDIKEYTYIDSTPEPGINYVYRITAKFADVITENGDPLNFSQSAPSDGVCESLPRDLPTMLNVSVENTDAANGEMFVRWAKPNPIDLDTIINAPPYTYELLRSTNAGTFESIVSYTANSFATANDTVFTDSNLNTLDDTFTYKVRFSTGDIVLGDTPSASSIYITTTPNDNQVQISWNEQVPWLNLEYTVYRKLPNGAIFEELTTVNSQSYTDTDLTNGLEYCYYVSSSGTYNADGLPEPLINLSQEKCDIPIDTTPPCAPELTVSNDCDTEDTGEPLSFDSNLLNWTLADNICEEDAERFKVFYQAPNATDFELLEELDNADARAYLHMIENTLAGCYAITAIDSFNNESLQSNVVCTESCLIYELPNTFTPNSDNQNDMFVPLQGFRFVNKVDMNIFTKWGNLVFETKDPAINWDGKEQKTEKELPTGTYYYTCKVFEINSDGSETVAQELSGYIHLFRE